MAKFKIGDRVVLSEKAFRENEGCLWISKVCEFLGKNKFLTVESTSPSCSHCNIEEFPQYIFKESWLEPYIDCEPSPLHLGIAAYMPKEVWLPKEEFSVRDRFAAAALSGMLAHSTRYKPREEGADWHWSIAKEAYELADAMMEARKI